MADSPAIWLPPFQVNVGDAAVRFDGTNAQQAPYIARTKDGAVVIWEDYGARCEFEPADVAYRRLNVAGTRLGVERPCINSAIDWSQTKLSFHALSNGNGYAVYQRDDPALLQDVWFDLVDPDGQPVTDGNPFHFIVRNANEGSPAAAVLDGGAFAIAYTDDAAGEFDLKFDIVADPINAPGTHLGEQVLVDGTGEAIDPDMAALSDGNFVVAYAQATAGVHHIRIVIGKADGTLVTVADPAVETGSGDVTAPAVTALTGGGFVVTWSDPNAEGAGRRGIKARIYSNAGVPAGPAFLANVVKPGDQTDPDVAVTPTGFLIGWTDVPGGKVRVRRFLANGTPTGSEVLIGPTGGAASQPSLGALADGRVVLAFTGTVADNADVYAAILDDRDGPITGTAGNDTLTAPGVGGGVTGLAGTDTLYGSNQIDSLDGGPNADRMEGRTGSDVYTVDSTSDLVVEPAAGGTDTIRSTVSQTLPANVEKLILLGASNVNGTGNGLDNTVSGNAGINRVSGLAGKDILSGLAGGDTFVFAATPGEADADTVKDFDSTDKIELSRAVMPALPASLTLPASAFVLGTGAATPAQRIVYDRPTGRLFYDADGSNAGPQALIATFTGSPSVTPGRFRLK